MHLRPIRTETDHETAMREIERLWGAKEGTPEGDRLEVLSTLVETYEESHFPIDLPDPIDAIRFRLEQQGADTKALIGVIGNRTRVYEVLRRDRALSLEMIRKLHHTSAYQQKFSSVRYECERRVALPDEPSSKRLPFLDLKGQAIPCP